MFGEDRDLSKHLFTPSFIPGCHKLAASTRMSVRTHSVRCLTSGAHPPSTAITSSMHLAVVQCLEKSAALPVRRPPV
eukprot:3007313-Amphidinium_carterae.1